MLTLKIILEINDSYLMSCEKLESYEEKKGDVMNLTEMPHAPFLMMLIF